MVFIIVDQRFILKQMSGAEIDVFEKFGPEYFTYMSKSYLEQVSNINYIYFKLYLSIYLIFCWSV